MRPARQSDTQLHANARHFEAPALQKRAEFRKETLPCRKYKMFLMLIEFIQVVFTPRIVTLHRQHDRR